MNRARSVGCAALLALAGCANAPPPAPAPPAPVERAPKKLPPLVDWRAYDSTIACTLTETELSIPEGWIDNVRAINATEVVVLPAGKRRGAVLVRAAKTKLTASEFLNELEDDLKRLFEAVGVPLPKPLGEVEVKDTDPPFPDIETADETLPPIEYKADPPFGEFVLGYRFILRGGATCRISTIEPKPLANEPSLSDLVDTARTPFDMDPSGWEALKRRQKPPLPTIPPASCKAWPVWILPSCRPAAPAPKASP